MATIRPPLKNALDDLADERRRQLQDMLPAIRQAQDLMSTEALRSNSSALETAKNLTAASDALKNALRVDTSMLDIGKTIAEQMDRTGAMKSALQVDTSALDAMKSLALASDAIRTALQMDTSVFTAATKALAAQAETAAAMMTALQIDTSALDVVKNLTLASDAIRNALQVDTSAFTVATKALAAQAETAAAMKAALQIDISALDWAKTLAPQFDTVRPLVAALRRAIPELPKFELSPGVQEAMKCLSAMNVAPQFAAALAPPAGFADLMRDVAKFRTSIDMPALFQAQEAAASIAASLRLSDLTPERFGIVFTEGEADAAWLRLMAKAEAIAADNDAAAPEALIALAEDADAVTVAVPPEDRGRVALMIQMLILALIVELLKDGIVAGAKALLPCLVALPLSFQPVPLPALPPAPLLFSAPPSQDGGALGLPRAWEVEGLPQIIRRAGPEAERRTLEFFKTGIRNRNTRQAYAQAVLRFLTWCEDRNLELADITVFTVSAYIAEMSREYSARSVRQHLGAIRSLFDQLVAGNVVPMNPASAVRGPQDDRQKTKTSAAAMQPQEIRLLIDSIDTGDCSGLRDRALIAMMAYGFARVSAVVMMDVKDCFERDGHCWMRLSDRNGAYEIPLHTKAKAHLDAYLAAARIGDEPDSPLWRTMTKERSFSGERVSRVDVFRMVKRRLRDAGLPPSANCDSIRAAGIASYLANGGTLARASVQFEPGIGITATEIARIGI